MYLWEYYSESIADTSAIVCDEIINATDSVSKNLTNIIPTNMINTISTNIPSAVLINSDDNKWRYKMNCNILHMFWMMTILLFTIAIICYHYAKHSSKQKTIGTLTI